MKKKLALLLAALMVVSSFAACSASEAEESTSSEEESSTSSEEVSDEEDYVYATMNMPYADFYSAEIEDNDFAVDAVTSDTTSKWMNYDYTYFAELEDGSGGGTIYGPKYPVLISQELLDEHVDDDDYMSSATNIRKKIIEAQDIDVDVITGATYSSNGIKNAVLDALS